MHTVGVDIAELGEMGGRDRKEPEQGETGQDKTEQDRTSYDRIRQYKKG